MSAAEQPLDRAVKHMDCGVSNPVLLRRAVRFAVTGAFVTGVHFVVAIMFIRFIISSPPLANGTAFISASIVSYLINTLWSFSGRLHGRTLFRFVAVSIVGLWLAMLVAFCAQHIGVGYLVGICAVAFIVPPVTFLMHHFWTYN